MYFVLLLVFCCYLFFPVIGMNLRLYKINIYFNSMSNRTVKESCHLMLQLKLVSVIKDKLNHSKFPQKYISATNNCILLRYLIKKDLKTGRIFGAILRRSNTLFPVEDAGSEGNKTSPKQRVIISSSMFAVLKCFFFFFH